jgi:2-oxoisovalerate dehydrogenase E1 component alpha subunit
MFEDVFAEVPWHIAEQREQALSEAREFLGRDPS